MEESLVVKQTQDEEMPSLAPKQKWSIKRAKKRLNIWHGSVRSGKTVGTVYRWAQYVTFAPRGDLLMIGKTIDALKRNVISPLIDLVGGSEARHFSGRREFKIFGRICHTIGASDERSAEKIRGCTVAGALGDELTLWPEAVFQMMLSRMSVTGAMFFGTTNPDNPNHWLKRGFIDRRKELDMACFHFGIDDNPFLDPAFVEQLKREYTGLWYKRFILGEWCVAEGAIYDFFDEKKHTLPENALPEPEWYEAAYDYGTSNPCTFALYGCRLTGKPRAWLEREYYYDPARRGRQQTDVEFSKDFRDFIQPVKDKVRAIYADPSAESFTLQLKRDGVVGIRDAENEVLDGIRTVARMWMNGDYAVSQGCRDTVDEAFGYVWDPKKQVRGEDAPLKRRDHAMDRDRYFLHTKYGMGTYDLSKFVG